MKMNLLPAHEHVIYWIQQITGSKMAQSDLRIEIEQPQVFFYFPNDNHVYICVFPCSSFVLVFLRDCTFLIDEDTKGNL